MNSSLSPPPSPPSVMLPFCAFWFSYSNSTRVCFFKLDLFLWLCDWQFSLDNIPGTYRYVRSHHCCIRKTGLFQPLFSSRFFLFSPQEMPQCGHACQSLCSAASVPLRCMVSGGITESKGYVHSQCYLVNSARLLSGKLPWFTIPPTDPERALSSDLAYI